MFVKPPSFRGLRTLADWYYDTELLCVKIKLIQNYFHISLSTKMCMNCTAFITNKN